MRGFSTLEILIAMAIMVSTLSAVVLVSFGNQSLLAATRANSGALADAQALLETEAGNARQDFRLVTTVATSSDGGYQASLSVDDLPADPYTTKRLTAIVSWRDERHATRSISLTSLVTDFQDPSTLDTCDSSLAGDWSHPAISNLALSPGSLLPSDAKIAAANTIGAIDAYRDKLYVADASRSAKADDSLFIFDISNPIAPRYLGSTNNATTSADGMNAIVAAGDYLYAASNHGTTFKTCKPGGNCSQLQIFNVSNPAAISLVSDFLLPTSSAPFVLGSGGQAVGNALYYKNGYLYLGLVKTQSGPEFDVIDVHDPTRPAWIGGLAIGATVNQIYVRNGYAYLATDDQSRKFLTIDVHDPKNPSLVTSLDPKGTSNQEYGYSLYVVGDELFAGMSSTSISGSPELYEFNNAHPSAPAAFASEEVGASTLGIFARDAKLFLLTSTIGLKGQVQILDDDLAGNNSVSVALPGTGVSMDCQGNYFYVASNSGSQGALSIIGPSL